MPGVEPTRCPPPEQALPDPMVDLSLGVPCPPCEMIPIGEGGVTPSEAGPAGPPPGGGSATAAAAGGARPTGPPLIEASATRMPPRKAIPTAAAVGGATGFLILERDEGQTDYCLMQSDAQLTIGGTYSVLGPPYALDYTVNLTGVPADARIIEARATYEVGYPTPPPVEAQVTDDGGWIQGTWEMTVDWSPEAIAGLNAGMRRTDFAVHAEASIIYSPSSQNQFTATQFLVRWWEPGAM